jgi:hypothetical protein
MSNLGRVLEQAGTGFDFFMDKSGDTIESGFEFLGDASDFTLDSIGDLLSNLPKYGDGISAKLDKAGDSARDEMYKAGEYIDESLDNAGHKVKEFMTSTAQKFDLADKFGLSAKEQFGIMSEIILSTNEPSSGPFSDISEEDAKFFNQENNFTF